MIISFLHQQCFANIGVNLVPWTVAATGKVHFLGRAGTHTVVLQELARPAQPHPLGHTHDRHSSCRGGTAEVLACRMESAKTIVSHTSQTLTYICNISS